MAERFLYNFSMYGAFPEEEGGSDFLLPGGLPCGINQKIPCGTHRTGIFLELEDPRRSPQRRR